MTEEQVAILDIWKELTRIAGLGRDTMSAVNDLRDAFEALRVRTEGLEVGIPQITRIADMGDGIDGLVGD